MVVELDEFGGATAIMRGSYFRGTRAFMRAAFKDSIRNTFSANAEQQYQIANDTRKFANVGDDIA